MQNPVSGESFNVFCLARGALGYWSSSKAFRVLGCTLAVQRMNCRVFGSPTRWLISCSYHKQTVCVVRVAAVHVILLAICITLKALNPSPELLRRCSGHGEFALN